MKCIFYVRTSKSVLERHLFNKYVFGTIDFESPCVVSAENLRDENKDAKMGLCGFG